MARGESSVAQQMRGDAFRTLCDAKALSVEGCDWVKSAVDPFHDYQLANLRGYPDVSTEPTVIVKVRQAINVSKPPGLKDDENWDCHIVLSPVDFCNTIGGAPNDTDPADNGYGGGFRTKYFTAPGSQADPAVPTSTNYFAAGDSMIMNGGASDRSPRRAARMDGLVINTVASGQPTFDGASMSVPHSATDDWQMQQINLDDYLKFEDNELASYRLIYSGFEIVNTTAQIKKQGQCTVYEYGNSYETVQGSALTFGEQPTTASPRYVVDAQYTHSTPAVGWSADHYALLPVNTQSHTAFRMPPSTIAEAKIMPSSHSWQAQDGAYCTAKFQTENPYQVADRRNFVFAQNDGDGSDSWMSASMGYDRKFPSVSSGYPLVGRDRPGRTHFSRMNTPGAYLTGLSPETTLFVTWRVGIERLPAAFNPTFLALAQPSACYDPVAQQLYAAVCCIMPPGCPQGYNDAGKWFRMIKDAAGKVLPSIAPYIPMVSKMLVATGNPVAASAVMAAGRGVQAVQEARAMTTISKAAQRRRKQRATPNFGPPGKPSNGNPVQTFNQQNNRPR